VVRESGGGGDSGGVAWRVAVLVMTRTLTVTAVAMMMAACPGVMLMMAMFLGQVHTVRITFLSQNHIHAPRTSGKKRETHENAPNGTSHGTRENRVSVVTRTRVSVVTRTRVSVATRTRVSVMTPARKVRPLAAHGTKRWESSLWARDMVMIRWAALSATSCL
jgi:hypothetical protein